MAYKEPGFDLSMTDRVIDRGQRCGSCIHWVNDENLVAREWDVDFDHLLQGEYARIAKNGGRIATNLLARPDARAHVSRYVRQGIPVPDAEIRVERELAQLSVGGPAGDIRQADRGVKSQRKRDHEVRSGQYGFCRGNGVDKNGKPVGKYVHFSHLCHHFSGRPGWTLAKADGKLDPLPDEIQDIVDGRAKPVTK